MKNIEPIYIDFQVLNTNDPKVILIADNSEWGHIEEKPSIIEITLPGEQNPIINYFYKKNINSFNSINLLYNCWDTCGKIEHLDLPDGIYGITVKGSPDTFNKERKYLKTTLTQLELDKILINTITECECVDKEIVDRINTIELLLKAARAHIRYDNTCKAQEFLLESKNLIKKLKNCKGCVGV